MKVMLNKLPRKAQNKIEEIKEILMLAYELGWKIDKVEYKSGMIRHRMDSMYINFYTTRFTVDIGRENNEGEFHQYFFRYIGADGVMEAYIDPVNFKKVIRR